MKGAIVNLEPLRTRVAAHLDEPAVGEWALSVLRDFHHLRLAEERRQLEEAWFGDPERVARWLAEDDPLLGSALLSELPPERFSAAVKLLAERWPAWSDERTQLGAVALATLASARAAEVFRKALAAEPDRLTRLAILEAAGLVGPEARGLEEEALSRLAFGDEPAEPRWLARRLRSDDGLAATSTLAAVTRWLRSGNFDERLAWLAETLYGHAAFFGLALDLAQGTSTLGFAELPPLFPPDAPLARWDRLLVGEPGLSLSELLGDLEAKAASHPPAGFAARLVTSLAPVSSLEEKGSLAAFAAAGLAHTWELPAPPLAELSTEQLLDIGDFWLPVAPFHLTLARALAEKPRQKVLAGVADRIACELELGLPPGLSPRLLEALAELEEPELAPVFVRLLHDSSEDEGLEAATAALVRLGEAAVDEILRRWSRLDSCQRTYSLQVLGALGGGAVVAFLESRFDELADEVGDLLGSAVVHQLEPHFLTPLAERLDHDEPWVLEAFLVLARLADEAPPRLEEARARWSEHRVEELARRAAANAVPEVLELPLRCASCGHRAIYACRQIYCSREEGDEPMLSDELPCAGCGRLTDLLVVPEAWPQLEAELARSELARSDQSADARRGSSVVSTEHLELPDGRSAPFSTAFAVLRRRQAEAAPDLRSLLDASTIHRQADRTTAAINFRRQAVALDPTAIEAFWSLAQLLLEQDQTRAAFRVLRQALEHEPRWHFASPHPQNNPAAFRRELTKIYNELRQSLAATDAPPAPSVLSQKRQKVGRNDPCPCGSGKKFKKCCGG